MSKEEFIINANLNMYKRGCGHFLLVMILFCIQQDLMFQKSYYLYYLDDMQYRSQALKIPSFLEYIEKMGITYLCI